MAYYQPPARGVAASHPQASKLFLPEEAISVLDLEIFLHS